MFVCSAVGLPGEPFSMHGALLQIRTLVYGIGGDVFEVKIEFIPGK